MERPFSVLRDNTSMLINVISLASQQRNLSRFVFASTSEVYAGTLQYFDLPFPTPEDTPLAVTDVKHPRTGYMLSKIYGEALCRQSGLPNTIVRPHNIYGPRMGMAHVIPEQLKKIYEAKAGSNVEVHSSDHRRCFCYVSDAVEMLNRIVYENNCAEEVLNIGSQGPEVTIQEVAEICIETVGKNLTIRPMPAVAGSPTRRCPDMSRIRELIGYESTVDLTEGVKKTWQWYKNIFDGGGVSAI